MPSPLRSIWTARPHACVGARARQILGEDKRTGGQGREQPHPACPGPHAVLASRPNTSRLKDSCLRLLEPGPEENTPAAIARGVRARFEGRSGGPRAETGARNPLDPVDTPVHVAISEVRNEYRCFPHGRGGAQGKRGPLRFWDGRDAVGRFLPDKGDQEAPQHPAEHPAYDLPASGEPGAAMRRNIPSCPR